MSLLIGILTVVLVFTSIFLVLVVLMQRAKDGGIGAAMGGGSMESTFGAETGNVLSSATIKAAVVFFVASFILYLAHIYQMKHSDGNETKLPTVAAPASTTPMPMPLTAGPVPAPATPATSAAPQPATSQPVEPKKP